MIAHTRVAVATVCLLLAGFGYLRQPQAIEARVYFAAALGTFPIAVFILLVVRRAAYRWWTGSVTSVLDVVVVTVALFAFLLTGRPHAAVNSQVVYPIYFLALAATSLRLDHRASAIAGLAAVAGYSGVVIVAATGWDLNGARLQPSGYGTFSAGAQAGRILLLAAMGSIGVVVNHRMRKPHILSAADSLTGLMNRRAFEERWEGEVARARRYGRPISIAAIDIDYFKQFNDTYGHAAGDTALTSVSRVIRSRIRAGDFVARLGGEEFAVALPETGSASAVSLAEQLRKAVAANPITIAGQRAPVGVTVSIGVASWPEHGEEISRLLDRADDRLYSAKLAGRDQVKGPVALPVSIGQPVSL